VTVVQTNKQRNKSTCHIFGWSVPADRQSLYALLRCDALPVSCHGLYVCALGLYLLSGLVCDLLPTRLFSKLGGFAQKCKRVYWQKCILFHNLNVLCLENTLDLWCHTYSGGPHFEWALLSLVVKETWLSGLQVVSPKMHASPQTLQIVFTHVPSGSAIN